MIYVSLLVLSGIFVVLSTRNALVWFIGVELMLVGCGLLFVIGGNLHNDPAKGQLFAVFIIAVAAAQAAVAFALILNVYRKYDTIRLDKINSLKERD